MKYALGITAVLALLFKGSACDMLTSPPEIQTETDRPSQGGGQAGDKTGSQTLARGGAERHVDGQMDDEMRFSRSAVAEAQGGGFGQGDAAWNNVGNNGFGNPNIFVSTNRCPNGCMTCCNSNWRYPWLGNVQLG